ncbi:tyrosine-type recombinase/integrase [endosymbiont GvMRE of Glomus versiforme]|uniref:tyrosine-type recombinase/integrase n=1 Tax=endosymbiont GvMRE of Glomus versiforme TaxID=2039283 RepID=UPI0011C49048|nr:tyrosine-type recombinase/integrase [endosymbiont GvMRE of Glomus versiforme]
MNKKPLTILPTQQILQQVWEYLVTRPNKRGESKRDQHESLFLLCWKAGLRISEAIHFDLNLEHQTPEYKNLYLLRGKGNKERWVYISPEIAKELKKRDWKPNQANRLSFFDFLKQLKQESKLPEQMELAPHTLRRCFATHNVMSGMPLPVLQKVLGHSSLAVTSKYVRAGTLDNLLKYKPV